MPVLKSGKKWKIGHGKPMYKTKASAERAYKGYLFSKYGKGEKMNAKKILEMLAEEISATPGQANSDQGWFGEKFMNCTESVLGSIKESNPDLDKTKQEIMKIHSELNKLKLTIHKEKEMGKSDSMLDGLKKKWQDLQSKIVQIWHSYDAKHGTKYAAAYA